MVANFVIYKPKLLNISSYKKVLGSFRTLFFHSSNLFPSTHIFPVTLGNESSTPSVILLELNKQIVCIYASLLIKPILPSIQNVSESTTPTIAAKAMPFN